MIDHQWQSLKVAGIYKEDKGDDIWRLIAWHIMHGELFIELVRVTRIRRTDSDAI